MRLKRPLILTCLLVLAFSGELTANEVKKIEWEKVPGATFYKGTIESNETSYSITTDSTWILMNVGSETVKKVDAWGPRGPIRSEIEVLQTALQDIEPKIKPYTPPEEPEAPLETTDGSSDVEDGLTPEMVPEEGLTSFTTLYRIGIGIGMGRQWLQSEMGISEFNGGANIGGTILSGTKVSTESPLWYEGEFSAHNFTTETIVSGPSEGTKTEETNTQFRLRLSAFYNFFQEVSSPHSGLSIGAGLQYLSHPMLTLTDKLSGAASMKSGTTLALNLGARYVTLVSIKNLLVTGADIAPLSFSNGTKTLSTRLYTEWLNLITPTIYTNLGLHLGREKLTVEGECPAVTNCTKNGVTDSDIVQIRMGLAVGF